MSKLIKLPSKNDPLKDWEANESIRLENSGKNKILFIQEDKTLNLYKPKSRVYKNPKNIARRAEIMAIKDEIQRSLNSTISIAYAKKKDAVQKRKKELIDIKKILKKQINRNQMFY